MGFISTFFGRLVRPKQRVELAPGDPAPAFEALDHQGRRVRSSDFAGQRVVLWFYPKAATPG